MWHIYTTLNTADASKLLKFLPETSLEKTTQISTKHYTGLKYAVVIRAILVSAPLVASVNHKLGEANYFGCCPTLASSA